MAERKRKRPVRGKRRISEKRKKALRRRKRKVLFYRCLLATAVILLFAGIGRGISFILQQDEKPLLSDACESYRPVVEEQAGRYGMSEYVDLIMAVMMQESSGNGTDVMQAAEGAFNEKYPKTPGGILDPEYSIECGIQELKKALENAGVENPEDIQRIRLALQSYNFGPGYLTFVKERGETAWTQENAQDFARIASENQLRKEEDPFKDAAGPWDYGDQYYPDHVLRYYSKASENAG